MADTPAQPAGRVAQETWLRNQPNNWAVQEFTVHPADPVTGREFNAAVVEVAAANDFVGEARVQLALAFSERQLLDLADEIRRKLRPTSGDRLRDALDGIADRLDARGS